jgi:hypothetical protein
MDADSQPDAGFSDRAFEHGLRHSQSIFPYVRMCSQSGGENDELVRMGKPVRSDLHRLRVIPGIPRGSRHR